MVEPPGLTGTVRVEAAVARVRLRLVVRADGSVGEAAVVVSSGDQGLDAAALAAARHWQFRPARRDGAATASVVLIWVAFVREP